MSFWPAAARSTFRIFAAATLASVLHKVAPMATGERGFGFAGHRQRLGASAIRADLLWVAHVPSAPRLLSARRLLSMLPV
jgi:hypothetical protein